MKLTTYLLHTGPDRELAYLNNAHGLMIKMAGLHLVVCAVIAAYTDTWGLVLAFGLPSFVISWWAARKYPTALISKITMAAAFMVFTGLVIQQTRGDLEGHFSYFVMLAGLVVYCDWRPLVFATVLILIHHLVFALLQPLGCGFYVFNDVIANGTNFGFGYRRTLLGHFGVHFFVGAIQTIVQIYAADMLRRMVSASYVISDTALEIANGNLDAKFDPQDVKQSEMLSAVHSMQQQLLRHREAAIRQTENHFVTILDSLDEIIWSASAPDFRLRHVSAAIERLYGVSKQEFMDDHELWFKFIHPDDQLRVQEATDKILKVGKTELEYRIRRSDGQERWLSDRMYVVYGENGEPTELVGTIYDVTEYKQSEDARRDIQKRLLYMLETSPIAVRIAASAGHKVLFANERYAKLINSPPEQVTGKDPQNYYANPQDYEDILQRIRNGILVTEKLIELSIPGVGTTWAMASYRQIEYDDEQAVLGWFYDVTDLRQTQEALRLSEQTAKQSLDELKHQKFTLDKHAIVAVTDVQGRITYANEKFSEISGYSQEELIGQDHAILNSGYHPKGFFKNMYRTVASGKPWHDEVCNRAKDGHLYWVDTTIAPFMGEDGKPQSYISIRTDISQRIAAEEKSSHLALYDALTELPNRRLLMDRMQQVLAASERSGKYGALLFIDLDNFKMLNDTLGHDIGDLLLQQVSQRLVSCVREGDTVARLGGDEFVLVLEDLSENPQEAAFQTEIAAEKILNALTQPYQLDSHDHSSTPSIGVALFSGNQVSIDELMKRADIAMYQSKKAGRNTIRFFDPNMQAAVENRSALENAMKQALPKRQFQLYYQMQVNNTGGIVGAEVLLRWQHPDRGMISPIDFIPLAEDNGMILPIGLWVLETACDQLKAWEGATGRQHLQLAVNVSSRQFRQPDFVEMVVNVVRKTSINPSLLKLELTESMVLDNVDEIVTKMQVLKDVGVKFSMDDFGTGHSSLSSLKKLPLDQLKIDQSFVRDIATDPDDAIIVQTIIAMANNLGMEIIAEGVETEEQRNFLKLHGCNHYQGYLFSKPVPIEEFEALLKHG